MICLSSPVRCERCGIPVSMGEVGYRKMGPGEPFMELCPNCDIRVSEILEARANEWGRILREKWTRERRIVNQ
jgi:hypothetical protein